jgi:hypothetical protein
MATDQKYERVCAGDVEIGDRIARARSHAFLTVLDKRVTAVAVKLTCERGWVLRPRQSMMLWCETPRKPEELAHVPIDQQTPSEQATSQPFNARRDSNEYARAAQARTRA